MAEFCLTCAQKMGFEPETLERGEICEGCGATGPIRNRQWTPHQIAIVVIILLSTLIAAMSCKNDKATTANVSSKAESDIDTLKVLETIETYMKAHNRDEEYAGFTDIGLFIKKLNSQWVAIDQINYYQKIAAFAALASKEEKLRVGYNLQDSKSDELYFNHLADSLTNNYKSLDTNKVLGIRVEVSYKQLRNDKTLSSNRTACFYLDSQYRIIDKSIYLDFVTIPVYPLEDAKLFFN